MNSRIACLMAFIFVLLAGVAPALGQASAAPVPAAADEAEQHVAVLDMQMLILPGTSAYLERAIELAARDGAQAVIVRLDTPGGILQTTQEMIQQIFQASIPVFIYVSPSGATATSAGVFVTLAGHIAAMAPGTTIGAAHPVTQEGKDIEGDMRAKVENATIAMVKAISEQRGRNVQWAEQSVKESSSVTESEALKQNVIDLVAADIPDLLRQAAGKEVVVAGKKTVLRDLSKLPIRRMEMGWREKAINVFAHPNVAALLWLAATTGLSLELYNPGAILPGVVGVICLILALAVSQIIPLSEGAVLLLVVGAALIGLDLFFASMVLGIGGVIAMVLGAMYLIDTDQAPGMFVSMQLIIPVATAFGLLLLLAGRAAIRNMRRKAATGMEGMIGERGRVVEVVGPHGKVMVRGEVWRAESESGILQKDEAVRVVGTKKGLTLLVEPENK